MVQADYAPGQAPDDLDNGPIVGSHWDVEHGPTLSDEYDLVDANGFAMEEPLEQVKLDRDRDNRITIVAFVLAFCSLLFAPLLVCGPAACMVASYIQNRGRRYTVYRVVVLMYMLGIVTIVGICLFLYYG